MASISGLPELGTIVSVGSPFAPSAPSIGLFDAPTRSVGALKWHELRAAFADYDPVLLRRALLGESGSGSAGCDLLADAIACAEDETGG
jgi:hypothetical protein